MPCAQIVPAVVVRIPDHAVVVAALLSVFPYLPPEVRAPREGPFKTG